MIGDSGGGTRAHDLLATCAGPDIGLSRRVLSEADIASIADELDWALFVALARRNRVVPLVDHALAPIRGRPVVPASVDAELRAERVHHAVQTDHLMRSLAEVGNVLTAAGVRALAFKGPTLGIVVYGDARRRQFNDLDLLVSPADATRACAALTEAGLAAGEEFGWATSFRHPDGRTFVDLHHGLLPPEYRHGFDFERAWSRRQSVGIGRGETTTFGLPHLLICAALQVVKDGMENRLVLQKVADAAAIAARLTPADWADVAEEASGTRLRGMVAHALELGGVLGFAADPEIPVALRATGDAQRYAAEVAARLWAEDIRYPKPIELARRHRRVRERRVDGLTPFAVRAFADPADLEQRTSPESRLPWLRRVVRPIRLIAVHGYGAVRSRWRSLRH